MLDTDICVELIRKRPQPLLQRILAATPGSLLLSAVTVAELRYGVEKSRRPETNGKALEAFLRTFRLMAFDEGAAGRYGSVRADLEHRGIPIGPLDTLLGSHALELGATLVTHNVREFSRIEGLSLEDWLTS